MSGAGLWVDRMEECRKVRNELLVERAPDVLGTQIFSLNRVKGRRRNKKKHH